MKFVDEALISVKAGDGGRGCVAFLREKYRPHGGPSGGDGGAGGDVVFRADPGLTTLLDFRFQRHLEAGRGEHGRGKEQTGAAGAARVVRVPIGTRITDVESGALVADLARAGAEVVVARGGWGGRGNARFATSTNQAPRRVEPGLPGEARQLRLELRLLADVGLVGYPNAGKSTLIAAVSAARPRIADYPFTTLVPNLGVARVDDDAIVIADIPGLIAGAHRGLGLGMRFLRHVSRTAVLVHLVDLANAADPLAAYDAVNHELAAFDTALAAKPQIVVGTKLDVTEAYERFEAARAAFAARGVELFGISAVSGAGVSALLARIAAAVRSTRAARAAGGDSADDETLAGSSGAADEDGTVADGAPGPHA
ncbi:MAG: GTPase ObgE [Deltaproteobacteria bacterium]|nr:GTPase ObgE [Deltaproteobacteria bacterium]